MDIEILLQFATDAQRKKLEAYKKYGSYRKAAKKLGINHSAIVKAVRQCERKASLKVNPTFELTEPVSEGHMLKGFSHLKKLANGDMVWLKYDRDQMEIAEIMREIVSNLSEDINPRQPIETYRPGSADLANLYTFTDYHIGMLAWHKEGGADWDISIAKDTLKCAFRDMYDRAPKADVAIINQLGDWLHYDSMTPETPTSGHVLDADGRAEKMIEASIDCLDFLVSEALKTHREVKVVIAQGNHDLYGSLWLKGMFQRLYADNPRVEFIVNAVPFYAFPWGANLLGFHHGHKVKFDKLPGLFMDEYRHLLGGTERTYIHMGHYHHKEVKEVGKTVVEMHRTLAARDAHSSYGGYHGERAADLITYHREHGEWSRLTVRPAPVTKTS